MKNSKQKNLVLFKRWRTDICLPSVAAYAKQQKSCKVCVLKPWRNNWHAPTYFLTTCKSETLNTGTNVKMWQTGKKRGRSARRLVAHPFRWQGTEHRELWPFGTAAQALLLLNRGSGHLPDCILPPLIVPTSTGSQDVPCMPLTLHLGYTFLDQVLHGLMAGGRWLIVLQTCITHRDLLKVWGDLAPPVCFSNQKVCEPQQTVQDLKDCFLKQLYAGAFEQGRAVQRRDGNMDKTSGCNQCVKSRRAGGKVRAAWRLLHQKPGVVTAPSQP